MKSIKFNKFLSIYYKCSFLISIKNYSNNILIRFFVIVFFYHLSFLLEILQFIINLIWKFFILNENIYLLNLSFILKKHSLKNKWNFCRRLFWVELWSKKWWKGFVLQTNSKGIRYLKWYRNWSFCQAFRL